MKYTRISLTNNRTVKMYYESNVEHLTIANAYQMINRFLKCRISNYKRTDYIPLDKLELLKEYEGDKKKLDGVCVYRVEEEHEELNYLNIY